MSLAVSTNGQAASPVQAGGSPPWTRMPKRQTPSSKKSKTSSSGCAIPTPRNSSPRCSMRAHPLGHRWQLLLVCLREQEGPTARTWSMHPALTEVVATEQRQRVAGQAAASPAVYVTQIIKGICQRTRRHDCGVPDSHEGIEPPVSAAEASSRDT